MKVKTSEQEESRKLFERYAAGRLRLPLEMIAAAMGGDRYLLMHPLNEWWAIWQASRAAIEIELPDANIYMDDESVSAINDCANAILAAGLTVKGDSK
ncbi:hypothetical protein [Atlantibacter subterraneus]|uniref:hypothetical protein n=1 Tax=Atlantibacter subterraneus TaxID=255519 RepID=UPI0028A99891|nr:hypothetical protein [Atlantibacter subterranea]